MKSKIIALSIVLALTTSGCDNKAGEKEHDHSTTAVTDHENHSQSGMDHHNTVSLNNGDKWEANKETTEGMNNMMNLIKNFPVDATGEDCLNMKEKLNAEYATIIEKCTMTGDSHNQLHNFLVPLSNYINELEAADLAECRKNLELINDHLTEYSNYFQ